MATSDRSSSSSEVTANPAPPTPVMADNTSFSITNHKLTGRNYLQWSQSMMMIVCRKGKDFYLSGLATCPKKNDSGFKTWRLENYMVMSWLINSMTNEIGENFLPLPLVQKIFGMQLGRHILAKRIMLKSLLHDLKQGDVPVTTYLTSVTRYWQQMDLFDVFEWKCPDDQARYKGILEKKRVLNFCAP